MNQTRAGVGDKVDSLLKISQSYSQACAALDYALLSTDKGAVVYYDDLPDSMFQVHSYPLELIESLAFAVKMDKIEDTENLMYQIEYMIRMKEFPPYYIRALFFNVVSIFMEKQKKAEESDQLEPAAMRILSQQLSSVQMIEILSGLYQMFRKKQMLFIQKRMSGWLRSGFISGNIMERVPYPWQRLLRILVCPLPGSAHYLRKRAGATLRSMWI